MINKNFENESVFNEKEFENFKKVQEKFKEMMLQTELEDESKKEIFISKDEKISEEELLPFVEKEIEILIKKGRRVSVIRNKIKNDVCFANNLINKAVKRYKKNK